MAKAFLKDICEKITDGSHNPPVGIPFSQHLMISSKNIDDDDISFDSPRYLSEADFQIENRRTQVKPNDLLMTIVGTVGRVAVVPKGVDNLCLQRSVGVLRPKSEVIDSRFLMYQLQSMRAELEKEAHGVAQKGIYLKQVEQLPIFIPCMKEQLNISSILDKTCCLISLRKQQLAKLNELVKARFIELFGDPVGNPMGWPTQTMKNVSVRLSDGPFGSNLKSAHYTAKGVRVIRLGNIGCGYFNDADISFISEEHYEKLKKYTCRAGEIVIATLGDPNLRACLIPSFVGFGINKSDCVHYIPKPNLLNNQFVCQYINCPETLTLASGMVHGQTRSRVSSGQLADLPIFLPPMELQEQFAAFVEQTNKSKLTIQQSLDKLELLKKSMMQKYFG